MRRTLKLTPFFILTCHSTVTFFLFSYDNPLENFLSTAKLLPVSKACYLVVSAKQQVVRLTESNLSLRENSVDGLKSLIEYGIIGLLGLMSVLAVAVALERYRYFRGLRLEEFSDRRLLELALTRRLHLIATVGSNAPYVGLLGTVFGIMLTFYTMGQTGMVDSARIMTGLALSLKATAAGLLVAIPAVVLYNLLLRRVKELLLTWEAHHG